MMFKGFNEREGKSGLFKQDAPVFYGPRAATVDAAAERKRPALKNILTGAPGMFSRPAVSEKDQALYADGLQDYLAGDVESAVLKWRQVPNHPEARRAMQRIFDDVNQEGRQ
jgi:hypothetical protein